MLQKKDYQNPSLRIIECVQDVVTASLTSLATENEQIDGFASAWLGQS